MDAQWCKEILEEAVEMHDKPEIINTDQGSQFSSEIFTHCVLSNDIEFSIDGTGRAIDNVFIERLWRSVKYESIYLNPPDPEWIAHFKKDGNLDVRVFDELCE